MLKVGFIYLLISNIIEAKLENKIFHSFNE